MSGLVGWSVGWWVCRRSWLVSQWVGGPVGELVGWSMDWWVCRCVGWLVSGLVGL